MMTNPTSETPPSEAEKAREVLLQRHEAILHALNVNDATSILERQLLDALFEEDQAGLGYLVGELRRAKQPGRRLSDEWIRKFEEKIGDRSDDERWQGVKAALLHTTTESERRVARNGSTALKNLEKDWKKKPTNKKQLLSLKKLKETVGDPLKEAMGHHLLEMEPWDLVKADILGETVESNDSEGGGGGEEEAAGDISEAGGDGGEKDKDTEERELLERHTALFRKLVKYVEDDKTAAARQRLNRVDYVMHAGCVHEDTEDDRRTGSAGSGNGKLIFALAAFVCDAAVDVVLADAEGDKGDGLNGHLGRLWASRIGKSPGDKDDKAWFGRVIDLVEEGGGFHGRDNVRLFFEKHRETIDQLRQTDGHDVKSVVGYAKELLDARMLLGHRWTSSDNETRVVKRIIMSGWRLQPTLADWQGEDGFGMGEGWSYDPFGEFSGEDLLPPVDDDDDNGRRSAPTTLEEHLAEDMFDDNRHGVDLCCIPDKTVGGGGTEAGGAGENVAAGRAILCVQCKYRSRFDVVFKEESGKKLRNYTEGLINVVEEYGVDVVDGVWSSTTLDAPFPFGRTGPSKMVSTDREAWSDKRFGALNVQSFDARFGRSSAFRRVKQAVREYEPAAEQPREAYKPRSDTQRRAILGMVKGVLEHNKCQGHMPCGFGKTFVSYMIAALLASSFDERIVELLRLDGGRGLGGPESEFASPRLVVFATPLQRLCHQGLADWCEYDGADGIFGHDNMITCTSSAPVGLKHKPPGKEIVDWLEERFRNNGDKPVAVFICYDSLEYLRDFCRQHKDEVLLVCDEAHVCVGSRKDDRGADGKYTFVHGFPAKYRMFQTATPKVHWDNAGTGDGKHGIGHIDGDQGGGKRKGGFDGATFACMNDATATGSFGPVAVNVSWQACMEHRPPLLARPVVRMMDASGLSETAQRLFSQSTVRLDPKTIRAVIGLDDNDDREKATGQEEQERAKKRRKEGLELKKRHTEQLKAVADLEEAVKALERKLEALPKPKKQGRKRKQDEAAGAGSSAGPSNADADADAGTDAEKAEATKAAKKELEDEKKKLKGAHTALNKTTLALQNLAAKKYGMLTKPTSARLIQYYSGILRSIAECPEAADEPGDHVSHVVSYHRTVARAQYSMAMVHLVAATLIDEYAAQDTDAARLAVARLSELSLGTVSCYQDPVRQDTTIQRFAYARCGILFNVGIMRVGQNLPIVNGVAFADPMLTMDGIIQSVGRGLRLYGPRGKRCHVFLPVYGRSAGGGGGGGGGGPGEGEGVGEVENGDDWEEDVDYLGEEALLVVEAWLDSLDEATRKKLEKGDAKLEKAHEIARKAVEHMADLGLGPQDMRQIGAAGVLCGPSSGGGGGSSDGVLSVRDIPARVERRADGKAPADEESRMMVDVLNAGTDAGGGANSSSADDGFTGLAEAIFRVATRTFSGVGRVWLGWMSKYRKVVAYVEEHGKVPPLGHPELGTWVNNQRRANRGQGTVKMTEARSRLLESIKNARGKRVWVWGGAQWMEMYLKLVAYVKEHGKLPPRTHPELGTWVSNQRQAKRGQGYRKMTEARSRLLESIENAQGKRVWDDDEAQWMASFDDLVAYMDEHEKMPTERSHQKLINWVKNQRKAKKGTGDRKMTGARIKLLEALPGWKWERPYPSPAEMKALIAAAKAAGTFPPPPPTGDALDPEAVEATANRPSAGDPTPPPTKRPRDTASPTPMARSTDASDDDDS